MGITHESIGPSVGCTRWLSSRHTAASHPKNRIDSMVTLIRSHLTADGCSELLASPRDSRRPALNSSLTESVPQCAVTRYPFDIWSAQQPSGGNLGFAP